MWIWKVITGGQTGVDQAALRAARACGIPTGGWAPKGWLTERGPAPCLADYGLIQDSSTDYRMRTVKNVDDAGAVLLIDTTPAPKLSAGTRLAMRASKNEAKGWVWRWRQVGDSWEPVEPLDFVQSVVEFALPSLDADVLMVGGNRESRAPGIRAAVEPVLRELFGRLKYLETTSSDN